MSDIVIKTQHTHVSIEVAAAVEGAPPIAGENPAFEYTPTRITALWRQDYEGVVLWHRAEIAASLKLANGELTPTFHYDLGNYQTLPAWAHQWIRDTGKTLEDR